jgi:hypothetical protein
MVVYSNCGRPNACCIEIEHDEENDLYIIYDLKEGWEVGNITFEQLVKLKELILTIEDNREDIEDLD